MRPTRALAPMVAAFAACSLAEPPADAAAEFAKRRTAAVQRAAKEHVSLARFAWSRKLYKVAFEQNVRAAELDPANAEAQKGAGRKLDGGVWKDDPASTVKKVNEGSESDREAALRALEEKRKPAFVKIVKDLEGLAESAAKGGLAREAEETWKFLLEYDTDHAKARAALGYEKQDNRWVPPEDVKKRAEGGKKIAGAKEGEEYAEQTATEKATGWKLTKRRSANFLVTGLYTDSQIRELVRCAEGARAAFLEEFRVEEGGLDFQVEFVFVQTKSEHETFVDTCDQIEPHNRTNYRNLGGFTKFRPAHFSEVVQGGGDWAYVKDVCVHDTIHHQFAAWSGVDTRAWLDEGMAYWFTDRLLKTAETRCIAFSMTGGGGGGGRSFDNPLDWKGLVREMIQDGTNPPIDEVMEGHINSLNARKGCKAWSLVDFMMTKHRDRFFAFIDHLRNDVKQEEAIREAFGVKGYRELDELWKDWVFEAY
ncbi:MAG: hypothetical protein HUU15_01900 [Candidatus Brocadiae bacterium]|nr:hypothetical protein [Candidatus Brocadiia bacterium]